VYISHIYTYVCIWENIYSCICIIYSPTYVHTHMITRYLAYCVYLTYIYVCIHVGEYTFLYIYSPTYIHTHMITWYLVYCVYLAYIYLCMYMGEYLFLYIYYIFSHICTYTYDNMISRILCISHIHICMYICRRIYILVNMFCHIYTYIYDDMISRILYLTQAYIYVGAYTKLPRTANSRWRDTESWDYFQKLSV